MLDARWRRAVDLAARYDVSLIVLHVTLHHASAQEVEHILGGSEITPSIRRDIDRLHQVSAPIPVSGSGGHHALSEALSKHIGQHVTATATAWAQKGWSAKGRLAHRLRLSDKTDRRGGQVGKREASGHGHPRSRRVGEHVSLQCLPIGAPNLPLCLFDNPLSTSGVDYRRRSIRGKPSTSASCIPRHSRSACRKLCGSPLRH